LILVAAVSGCSSSESLRLVESDSSDNSGGAQALLQGTLIADEDGCVRAQAGGSAVTLVWPKGYSAHGKRDSFEIRDGSDKVVARSGRILSIAGGSVDKFADAWTERDCADGSSLWIVGDITTT